jgi:hypothetical protein
LCLVVIDPFAKLPSRQDQTFVVTCYSLSRRIDQPFARCPRPVDLDTFRQRPAA